MSAASTLRRSRAAAPTLLAGAAAVGLLHSGVGPLALARRLREPAAWLASGPDAALLDLLALTAWAALAWLALTVGLTALGTAPGRVGALASASVRRVSPALLRRAAESLLCLGLVSGTVGGTAAAAVAAPAVPATAAGEPSPGEVRSPDTDWPIAPEAAPAPEPGPDPPPEPDGGLLAPPPRHDHPAEVVVVRRGDSLWRIAERHLGPAAGPAAVATAWPRWYEANRAVIGDDPDFLLPGQQLRPPA